MGTADDDLRWTLCILRISSVVQKLPCHKDILWELEGFTLPPVLAGRLISAGGVFTQLIAYLLQGFLVVRLQINPCLAVGFDNGRSFLIVLLGELFKTFAGTG